MQRRTPKPKESPPRNLNKRNYSGGAMPTSKRLRSTYPCLICDQIFPSLPDLRTHLSSAHPKEKVPCQECGKSFATHTSYMNHPCQREQKRPFLGKGFYDLMDITEFSTRSFSYIAKRYFEKHPRRGQSSLYHNFKCPSCNLIFPTDASLQLHIALSEESKTTCQKCDSDFICEYDLNIHHKRQSSCSDDVNNVTNDEISQESFLSTIGLMPNTILKKERFEPEIQPTVFESYSYFVNAKPDEIKVAAINLQNKSYFIPSSPKEASVPPSTEPLTPSLLPITTEINLIDNDKNPNSLNNIELNKDSNDNSNGTNICPHCDIKFENKLLLHQHMLNHEERNYVCKVCSYSFTTKSNCERHIQKIHQIKKKEEINYNIKFHSNNNLQDSTQSENETTCKYCLINFNTKKMLRRHKRSQEGCKYKPYKCTICKLGFSFKNNYKRHCINKHSDDIGMKTFLADNISFEENSSDTDEMGTARNEIIDNSNNDIPEIFTESGCQTKSDQSIQEEVPLDLTAKPLNLCLTQEEFRDRQPRPTSIITLANIKKKDIDTNEMIIISPVSSPGIPSLINVSSVNQPKDNSPPSQESNENILDQSKKHYTCSYCFAKFTLKSNMSRHIKKKHPGNARPSRSRNFIASISQPTAINKIAPNNASTETKIALRNSLLNKNSLLIKNVIKIPATEIKSSLKIIKDDQPAIVEDLASVSVLINNASSQQFSQYLNQSAETNPSNNFPLLSPVVDKDSITTSDSQEKKKNSYSSSPKRVQCTFCNRKFPWLSSLRRHLLTHTGQKPFQCPHCSVNFTTKSNCERHIAKKHGQNANNIRDISGRSFQCNLCPESTFSNQGNLQKHMYLKHQSENGEFDFNIKKEDEYLEIKESESDDVNSGDEMANGDLTTIPCPDCSLSFSTKEELEKHVESHSDLFYKCHLCPTFFKRFRFCIIHFEEKHPEEYLNLQKHEVIPNITPEDRGKIEVYPSSVDFSSKKVVCSICFYHCQSDSDLTSHMTSHNQDIYPCDICSKKFESISTLAKHKETHENGIHSPGPSNPTIQATSTYLVGNSLLPIISKKVSETIKLPANVEPISSDLIKNLLCLPDSVKIDELLAKNSDSAAEILGVVTSK
ncbi:RREB1 [Cordylochernes scorpioides]|uniref:RREB1 n=1 Tax=Cordylochernes scorpioides TaxID=51811 RepID=A0ABY6LUY3_9ARAC|nr:RREB1 [Cordylochernes scorpioides]